MRRLSLPDDWATWLLDEIDREEAKSAKKHRTLAASLQGKLDQAEERLRRLTDAYLDEALELDEYRDLKDNLLRERQELKEKLAAPATEDAGWLEPFRSFVKASNAGVCVAETGDAVSQRDFLTKAGSNLILRCRQLHVTPRGAWQLVAKQGFGPHTKNASPDPGEAKGRPQDDLSKKRRGEDSNLRYGVPPYDALAKRCLKPLGHLSRLTRRIGVPREKTLRRGPRRGKRADLRFVICDLATW